MEPELELYWFSGSEPSWRVMLALEVKGIPYVSRCLEASKREHRSPQFLELNPRGQVPIIRRGNLVVRESIAILAYLDALKRVPALFKHTPEQKGAIWQWVMDFENNLRPAVMRVAEILFRNQASTRGAELAQAIETISAELQSSIMALDQHPYLCGKTISAADIVLYPAIQWMKRANAIRPNAQVSAWMDEMFASGTGLVKWMERIELIPGYHRTYPPHWRKPQV